VSDGEGKVTTDEAAQQNGSDDRPLSVSRRRFLAGAGVGLAVGAAGAAGVVAIAPKQAGETTTTGQAAQTINLPASMRKVSLDINGKVVPDVTVDVRSSLWEVMTYQLGMVGANLGCDRAECGACAVVVDGRAVNSCTVLAARLGRGQKIITIEGLSNGTKAADLHPIQRAYWQKGGFQCGICTRGFIMTTYAMLNKTPVPIPTEAEVREALSGNICRCSEYPKIFDSVFSAAEEMSKK
jgi:aerobic-type carbon monoxide dehydrogenase small subunit (CoxS/CutS family)